MSFNIEDLKDTPNGEELIKRVEAKEITLSEAIIIGAKDVMKDSNKVKAKAKLIADEADKIRSK